MKNQKIGVLPAPTFKYGGQSYVLLSYAKMKKGPFDIESVKRFSNRFDGNRTIRRAVKVLLENDSIVEVEQDCWQITPTGVQQLMDFRARRQTI